MPSILVPTMQTKSLPKPSRGQIFGALWATRGIDLSVNKGRFRLSERLYRVFDSGDDSDMEVPVGFVRTDASATDQWWGLTQDNANSTSDGLLFKSTDTDPEGSWTQDAISNSPTDCVDNLVIFGANGGNDQMYVARDTDIAELNQGSWVADWWTNASHLNQSALAAGNPHPIHVFLNLMLVPDGNVIHTIDDSEVVVTSRLTFPDEYQVIWIENDGRRVYFGTRHIRDGESLVFPWDGSSDTYDAPLEVNSRISFAGKTDDSGILHVINGKGQLLADNGISLEEVAALPVAQTKRLLDDSQTIIKSVHPNGMEIIDGRVNILINANIDGNTNDMLENQLSGIWEYDKEIGLYHKHDVSLYDGSTDNSWAAGRMKHSGALVETVRGKGKFLVGVELYSDSGTNTTKAILASHERATAAQRGYFITAKMQGSAVRSFWTRLKLALEKLENSTDRIAIKYRILDDGNFRWDNPTVGSTTITDGDTFTTASDFTNVAAGDEIEFMIGAGAGFISHVSSISFSSPTYTVNLDDTIPNVTSGTGLVHAYKWISMGTISDQNINEKLYTIGKRSNWVQFKVVLLGTDTSPELNQLLAEFNPSKR